MKYNEFKSLLLKNSLPEDVYEKDLLLESDKKNITVLITGDPAGIRNQDPIIPFDYLKTMPDKILAMLESKLGINATVFARNCEVKKINRHDSEEFLNQYHMMGATQSGFNYGLYYKDELVAVASFSKGRKMNRLLADQRSFELIRFCCKPGLTITGGLTKLVKNFYIEKNAGDVMTYVDKQLSDGRSFTNAGFKKHSEVPPHYFLINKTTYERALLKDAGDTFDQEIFYKIQNSGSIKMIFNPNEKI